MTGILVRSRTTRQRLATGAIVCGLVMAGGTLKAQDDDDPLPGIYAMNVDGSNFRLLVKLEGKWNGTPGFSPDGKTLLFDASPASARVRNFEQGHVYVMPADGSAADAKDLGLGSAPRWSPDGGRIAFYVHDGNPEGAEGGVWIMNADGSKRTWVCAGHSPRWSPDGKRLVLVSDVEGTGDGLYLVDPQKKEELEVVLEKTCPFIAGVAWSPDGKRLAYIRGTGRGGAELVIQRLEGDDRAERVRLAKPPGDRRTMCGGQQIGWRPGWSPDGKYILCWIANAEGQEQLHRVEADTKREPELLAHQDEGLRNSDASWSSDGKQIVFMSDR